MKSYFSLVILLLAALGVFTFYANYAVVFLGEKAPFETIESLTFLEPSAVPSENSQEVQEPEEVAEKLASGPEPLDSVPADSLPVAQDSTTGIEPSADTTVVTVTDSTSQKQGETILMFGDSMVEGLVRRLDDYAEFNGHKLVSVLRFSSTTIRWAEVDNLKTLIDKEKPTFIMVALGSNELFVKDLRKAEKAIEKLMSWFGDTPFIWIGPPNWKKDTGINDLIIRKVGEDRFFESRNLTFTRCSDNIHPTFGSSERWMDKVVEWMNRDSSQIQIKMEKPSKRGHRRHKAKTWKQILP